MEKYTRELIYLFRHESLQSALNLLYGKYFNVLVRATAKYYYQYYKNYFHISLQDIQSICYENFINIIYTFDLNSFKYTFPQFLFIVNRSYFRDLMLHYLNNNGQFVLSNAYQYGNIDILSSQINNYHQQKYKTDDDTILKILISDIIEYAKNFAYLNFKGEVIKIFQFWIKGIKPEKFYKQTKFSYRKVMSIITSISRKINIAIINRFKFKVEHIPLNFCLRIQGF